MMDNSRNLDTLKIILLTGKMLLKLINPYITSVCSFVLVNKFVAKITTRGLYFNCYQQAHAVLPYLFFGRRILNLI